jgi:hypothetical protein
MGTPDECAGVPGLDGRASDGRWRQDEPHRPPGGAILQTDEATLPERDDRAVRVACEQESGELRQMRQVADEHQVPRLDGDTCRPDRWVVERREAVGVLDGNAECLTPRRGGLLRSRLAGMDDPLHGDAAGARGLANHASHVASTAVGERSLGIFLLALGLTVLDEIEPHVPPPHHAWGVTLAPAHARPTRAEGSNNT